MKQLHLEIHQIISIYHTRALCELSLLMLLDGFRTALFLLRRSVCKHLSVTPIPRKNKSIEIRLLGRERE